MQPRSSVVDRSSVASTAGRKTVASAGSTSDKQLVFKLVLVGQSGVGKTCVASRFVNDTFPVGVSSTFGASFMTKVVRVSDGWEHLPVKLEIWDTAGQERYHALSKLYYQNAHAAIIVYSIDDSKSFDVAKQWLQELRQQCSHQMVIALAANKADLETKRQVPTEVGSRFAERENILFLETSAASSRNVTPMFEAIAQRLTKIKPVAVLDSSNVVVLASPDPKARCSC